MRVLLRPGNWPPASLFRLASSSNAIGGTNVESDSNGPCWRASRRMLYGAELKLALTENAMIVAVVKASIADIKEGTYLGSAAMPQSDGSQKALEVHIFPEQMRGTGEGHRPYAPVPESTMTNGSTSGSMVAGVNGSTIVVRYKDGEKKIIIPPIVADRSLRNRRQGRSQDRREVHRAVSDQEAGRHAGGEPYQRRSRWRRAAIAILRPCASP